MIVIIIDDAGVDRKHTLKAIQQLPRNVTFAFLPYSLNLKEQVEMAQKEGHELIVHLPMEPEKGSLDTGPDALDINQTKDEIIKRVDKNLSAFDGYVGVNNHMGSKFSQYRAGLNIVMQELKKKDIFFLDSKTTAHSIAEKTAEENGVPTSHRDVFLDDSDEPENIRHEMRRAERLALKNGIAIVIGHPRKNTLKEFETWIPALKQKHFQLVPLSTAIYMHQKKHVLAAKAEAMP